VVKKRNEQMMTGFAILTGIAIFAVVITVLDAIGRRQQRRKSAESKSK
jgi:hypothetical protein